MTEDEIRENWFVNVMLNSALCLTLRMIALEDVVGEDTVRTEENNDIDLLLGMNIGNKEVSITIEGEG